MITYDEFEAITREEIALLPPYVQKDLTGGVLIDPSAYLHPARMADDLYILGTYSYGGIYGKQIILYYGSFRAVMGNAGARAVRRQIRDTVRHEFLHHMETRAGIFGRGSLVEEDRRRMMKYYMMHRREAGDGAPAGDGVPAGSGVSGGE